jgi:Tol biopolymer transport system component/tRNA A-37 threonylcarbamoyl transferase component Bud32
VTAALADRYRIERELGQGGMATVYLAEDLRHRRKVAVKVLRPELAATLGSERFFREIEVAARLQHPHILPLHDSGEAGGFLYYVMPYVEGESLRERLLRQRELPVHDAVKILIEIVDALAYAHSRGVVHRDIKPDNVLLSGRHALVTDFGVAKAVSEATGRQQLTTAGVALGTPAYMAPEQAAADPHIDHRVDIYAVGVVGYELLTGRPPFTGISAQEVLAAHVTRAPEPVTAHRASVPQPLGTVIMKCLEKRPADRWQTADELLGQLEPLATPSSGLTPAQTQPFPAASAPAGLRRLMPVALLAAVAGLAALLWPRGKAPDIEIGRRTQITQDPGLEYDPVLSPDGRFVAYTVAYQGGNRIMVQQVDGGTPVMIARDAPSLQAFPAWSPDSRRLLFLSERGVEVIPALGGNAKVAVPAPSVPQFFFPGCWSPDGTEVSYVFRDTVLARRVETRTTRAIAVAKEAHSLAWSADGRWLAFVVGNSQARLPGSVYGNIAPSQIMVVPAKGGIPAEVTDRASANISPQWVPGSRTLLFISNRDGGNDIYEVPLGSDGRPRNMPRRITTGLGANTISLAADGRTVGFAPFSERSNIWSLPVPKGGPVSVSDARPLTAGNQVIESFAISPDGRTMVFDAERGGRVDLYRMHLPDGQPESFVTGEEPEFFPTFSPDGREIAYHALKNGRRQIFLVSAEGGQPTQITDGPDDQRAAVWMPDGRGLLLTTNLTDSGYTSLMERNDQGAWSRPRPFNQAFVVQRGQWSPDGRYLAGSDRRFDLVLLPRGSDSLRQLVPAPAGEQVLPYVAWSDDASRALYLLATARGEVLPNATGEATGIWAMPLAGGRPQLLVRFDDPDRPWHRFGFRAHGGRLYFTLGERESDVWIAELKVK